MRLSCTGRRPTAALIRSPFPPTMSPTPRWPMSPTATAISTTLARLRFGALCPHYLCGKGDAVALLPLGGRDHGRVGQPGGRTPRDGNQRERLCGGQRGGRQPRHPLAGGRQRRADPHNQPAGAGQLFCRFVHDRDRRSIRLRSLCPQPPAGNHRLVEL